MSLTEYSPTSHELSPLTHDLERLALAWLGSFPSVRTRQAYSADLGAFSRWLEDHRAGTLLTATRPHVDLYARHLEEAGYSPSTRARRLSSLSSFYDYSCSVGALSVNPAANVRRPKLPRYSPRLGLNLDTAPRVVAAAHRLVPVPSCDAG